MPKKPRKAKPDECPTCSQLGVHHPRGEPCMVSKIDITERDGKPVMVARGVGGSNVVGVISKRDMERDGERITDEAWERACREFVELYGGEKD